ncbi:MAG: hypothetical protein ACKN9T_15815 [Candidatus Methylumidiphilus sp.]
MALLALALGLAACGGRSAKTAKPEQAPSALDAHCADNPTPTCGAGPSAAFDNSGKLWVVWELAGKVYVNYSSDLGRSYSQAVAVNSAAESIDTTGEARPKIAITKAGAICVAWTKRQGQASTVLFSRSLDSGRTFAKPLPVTSAPDSGQLEALAVNDRDYVYLAWVDGDGRGAGAGLYFTLSTDGGRAFRPPRKLADHACGQCRLAMKIDRKKFPAILWRQAAGGHALSHFTAKDQPGPVQTVDGAARQPTDAANAQGPVLSITAEGDYYAAWSAGKALYVNSSQDQGRTFSAPKAFGQSPQAAHPDLHADGQTLHLAWTESDGKKTLLLAQYSINGGLSWSAVKSLAETPSAADYPSVLAHQGHHYVAWKTQAEGYRIIATGN